MSSHIFDSLHIVSLQAEITPVPAIEGKILGLNLVRRGG